MTAPHSPSNPDDAPRKSDLNVAHVAGAALAAVTTAVVGSELGAAGTLIGAAAASVITTVGTTVYQASLERSREKVRTLAQRTRPLSPTQRQSRVEYPPTAPFDDNQLAGSTDHRSRQWVTLRWGAMAVGALGAFLVAMVVITGFEWANGEAVGGNGRGTTIGQVVTDQTGSPKPAAPPAPYGPSAPATEAPTQTTSVPGNPTTTTTPDGGTGGERSPAKTSDTPAPSEVTRTPPPLIPLPGIGR
ncbi:MAG TPA: hypothetical protein VIY28_06385 [Pseudonocardiaceae bacterium]